MDVWVVTGLADYGKSCYKHFSTGLNMNKYFHLSWIHFLGLELLACMTWQADQCLPRSQSLEPLIVRLHGKGKLRLLASRQRDFASGHHAITSVSIKLEEGRERKRSDWGHVRRIQLRTADFEDGGSKMESRNVGAFSKQEKAEDSPLGPPDSTQPWPHLDFSHVRPTSAFWPPKL